MKSTPNYHDNKFLAYFAECFWVCLLLEKLYIKKSS